MGSLIELLKLDLKIPHYSTFAKRQKNLDIGSPNSLESPQPLHLVVDSTGLKVFGEGEWKVRQHGTVKKRPWRKLHVAVNQENHMIEACVLRDLGIVKDWLSHGDF